MNNYSDLEYEIFSRLFILKEFSEKNINKLSKLKIGIVGMGGIGCPLSQYLVSSGITDLKLVDGDIIEKSNLNRQLLYNMKNLGEKKVKIAREKLISINSNCKISVTAENINHNNLEILNDCSIIVDATDNWSTSKLLNKYCNKKSISFLYSSVIQHHLQIILFSNSKTSEHLCLNCIFPNEEDVDLPRCETVGISGIAAGLAGLISAQKIINYFLNLNIETNILTISDSKQLTIENIVVKNRHDCYLNSI